MCVKKKWPIADIYADDPATRVEVKYSEEVSVMVDAWNEKIAKDPLAHFCPDWDFMLIFSDSPEFESCLCGLKSR